MNDVKNRMDRESQDLGIAIRDPNRRATKVCYL